MQIKIDDHDAFKSYACFNNVAYDHSKHSSKFETNQVNELSNLKSNSCLELEKKDNIIKIVQNNNKKLHFRLKTSEMMFDDVANQADSELDNITKNLQKKNEKLHFKLKNTEMKFDDVVNQADCELQKKDKAIESLQK